VIGIGFMSAPSYATALKTAIERAATLHDPRRWSSSVAAAGAADEPTLM
jgi:hypothetical protein